MSYSNQYILAQLGDSYRLGDIVVFFFFFSLTDLCFLLHVGSSLLHHTPPTSTVANLPPLASPHFNFRGAVGGDKGLIYVISQTWNATSTQSSIHTTDGESGTFLRTASVDSNSIAHLV